MGKDRSLVVKVAADEANEVLVAIMAQRSWYWSNICSPTRFQPAYVSRHTADGKVSSWSLRPSQPTHLHFPVTTSLATGLALLMRSSRHRHTRRGATRALHDAAPPAVPQEVELARALISSRSFSAARKQTRPWTFRTLAELKDLSGRRRPVSSINCQSNAARPGDIVLSAEAIALSSVSPTTDVSLSHLFLS